MFGPLRPATSPVARRIALAALTALTLHACGDDESDAPRGPGETCSDTAACQETLVCAPDLDGDSVCQRSVGAECDPGADDAFCVIGSSCYETDPNASNGEDAGNDPAGLCLIDGGGVCDGGQLDPLCAPELVCADHTDGVGRCREPVVVVGNVFDAQSLAPIGGARVLALDAQQFAVTDVAISDDEGHYRLGLPVERDPQGAPTDTAFTLRAAAADYQTFPSGLRRALPLNARNAVLSETAWVLQSTLTDLALLQLAEAERGRFAVSGAVDAADDSTGVLVVVEGAAAAWSAVSDRNGDFVVFNVPNGTHAIAGYAAGLQLEPQSVSVSDADVGDIVLTRALDDTVDVTGSVQIVETSGETSVILVVASTFDDDLERGEVPRGLRAPPTGPPNVSGSFTIAGVPAGDYYVLAAFENDGLVRDPDQNIGGTELVMITVPAGGADVTLDDSFKVNEAIVTLSPGADLPEVVTEAPFLRWERDASTEWYVLEVFNAFGDAVWSVDNVSGRGNDNPRVLYEGPLVPGMFYQFRVTSWRQPGGGDASPISRTEDLRGVFQLAPE